MNEIVVGVDGSPASDAALAYAAEEARAHGWRLVAVHTWTIPIPVGVPYVRFPTIDPNVLEVAAKDVLAHAVERVLGQHPDLSVDEVLIMGHAAEALVQRATGAQALVVGSRGHGGFSGLLLGSTSQQCAHHAACPVIIVHAPEGR